MFNEAFFHWNPDLLGLGQTNWVDNFGQNISTHDFPVGLYGAVGANLEGTSVVCRGYGSTEYSEKCYRFKNYVWEEFDVFNIFSNTFSLFQLETKNTLCPLKLFAYPTVFHWAFKSVT